MSQFQMPDDSQKAEFVKNNFDIIAEKYDKFNDLSSLYMHRHWKNQVIELIKEYTHPNFQAMDLCCGTGDISYRILEKTQAEKVYCVDFSDKMLSIAKQRLKGFPNVEIVPGDATKLSQFQTKSIDVVTVGFGLRNVDNIEAALSEIHRVLKPGGIFINLDVGKVSNGLIKPFADLYFFKIVPILGYMVWGQKNEMFDYLPASSVKYPEQKRLKDLLFEKGFMDVKYKEYVFGNVALHYGFKPD